MTLTDQQLQETVDAVALHGGQHQAAAALGLSQSTINYRLSLAARRNIGATGVLGGPLPLGQRLRGVSTLYGEDGQLRAQWVKTSQEPSLEDITAAIQSAFEEYEGWAVLPNRITSKTKQELLTVYPIADLHLGQYSWQEETGQDYDLEIASKLLTETMGQLVADSPPADTAIVLNLGDFFHSDSNENRTRRSGNVLDVDTRYAKVLQTGVNLMIATVQLALQKHQRVLVRNLQGNHDPYAALALSIALGAYFAGSERVTVDTSPSPFFFYRHGAVLLGATHGDMAKPAAMVTIMAAKRAEDWGVTRHRYIYLGHVHQKNMGGGDIAGATWETFQTLAPRDAWGNSMGFVSPRSMQSITHHAEHGEATRLTVTIRGAE